MGKRITATIVAILALALAAATALAVQDTKEGAPEGSDHTPGQLQQALELIGPQDPAITQGLISGCRDLLAQGLTNEACSELLSSAGIELAPVDPANAGGRR